MKIVRYSIWIAREVGENTFHSIPFKTFLEEEEAMNIAKDIRNTIRKAGMLTSTTTKVVSEDLVMIYISYKEF